MSHLSNYTATVWIALLAAAGARADNGLYQFHIAEDRLSGAPDFSFLNHPLGAEDRVFVRNGAFYRVGADLKAGTDDDERVRFFGVNLTFGACFPEPSDAARIARRLRRLGVNLVRLHHMDSSPDKDANNAGSILTTGPYPSFNPVAVKRLRGFLDALKSEGIYVNLNLHVGYNFRPAVDELPAHPQFPNQSKPLHIFFPRMVELQENFARGLMDALSLAQDPVLAMVEINNESSLIRDWQAGALDTALQGDYRSELQRQWNEFLRNRYATTSRLREVWGEGEADGDNILPGIWTLEKGAPSDGRFELREEGGQPLLRMEVTAQGPRLNLKQVGFSVRPARPLRAEVELRAELPPGATRSVYWDIKQDVSPWRSLVGRSLTVSNQWQKFTMAVEPTFAMDGIGRYSLAVANLDVPLWVRNWKLYEAGRRSLAAGENIEEGTVSLVEQGELAVEPRSNDYLSFLVDADKQYLRRIRDAVRLAGCADVPVAGTQMGFGGLMNLDSHEDLDYNDHHFYVDHYNFPNLRWDARDWRIRDSSSSGSAFSAILNVAAAREEGRPYTVSEFNQPWPNRQGAELVPVLSVFAAFQGWDAIMHFAYAHRRNWDEATPNGFNLTGDWTKYPGFGQSAWLFRSGALEEGRDPLNLPVTYDMRLEATRQKRNGAIAAYLQSKARYNPLAAFRYPVRLVRAGEDMEFPGEASQDFEDRVEASSGQFHFDTQRQLFVLHAALAAGVFGRAGKEPVSAGAITLELAPSARGFTALLVTSLDGEPLERSARMLVSNPGYTLRSQPGSQPPQPQRMILYPQTSDWWTIEPEPAAPHRPSGNYNSGVGPVWMERVETWLTIRNSARHLVVYPLSGAGARLQPLPAGQVQRDLGAFRIHLQAEGQELSPWYEIVAER